MRLTTTSFTATLEALDEVAKTFNVPIDKAAGIHLALLHKTATEKSDNETRNAAKTLIQKIYEEAPFADHDSNEITTRVGLKGPADRAWVRHQLKVLRLAHHQAAE